MNEGNYREYGGGISCYFHPKEVVVGVCHLCLNERLLIIAAKQGATTKSKTSKFLGSKHKKYNSTRSNNNSSYDDIPFKYHDKSKSYISFPKFFGIGSFFNAKDIIRHHRRHRHRSRNSNHDLFDIVVDNDDDDGDGDTTSTSLEDESFISIKFGDNGVASWDKTSSTVSKEPIEHSSLSWRGQTAVKDATLKGSGGNHSHKCVVEHPKPRPSMRWRKRIGQLLQVIKWKKSSSKANAGGGSGGGNNNNNNNNMVVRNNKTYIEDISMSKIY